MQLLTSDPNGSRNSKAIYWPGGQGELHAVGTFDGGTLTLYHAPLYIGQDNADEADQYNAHGATLSGSTKYNLFVASEGYLYLGFVEDGASDDFTAGIDYIGYKVDQQPREASTAAVA